MYLKMIMIKATGNKFFNTNRRFECRSQDVELLRHKPSNQILEEEYEILIVDLH